MKRKKIDIEITRLFMFKAGRKSWKRRFMGSIKQGVDNAGNPVVCGKVEVNDFVIYSQAPDEEQLGKQIDEIILIVLDYKLDYDIGVNSEISDLNYFLN